MDYSGSNFGKDLKGLFRFLFFSVLVLGLFEISISSCASQSSPQGGPRDTIAPQLDTSFPPNQTILFNATEIELRFEEYVELKNPFDQVNISPLLDEDIDVRGKGKKVFISLSDSLKENTTYIISFGSALTDLTEGNANKDFKYVFSTGTYIDSLEIMGTLFDAYTGAAQKEFLVALYSADRVSSRDTFLEVERPDYYAFSDEGGHFHMTNIKGGKYLLAAFTDKDGDFKRGSQKDPIAFWGDTILLSPDTIYDLDLLVYEPEQALRFYNARQEGPGHVQLAFNKPADSFKIELLNGVKDSGFFYFSPKHDTLNYYFDFKADSLVFRFNYDTLFVDSLVTVRLREMSTKLKFGTATKEVRPRDTIRFRSNRPILGWEKDSVWYITKQDSLHKIPQADSMDPFLWYFYPPQQSPLRFEMKKGAIRSFGMELESPKSFDIKLRSGEDLGSIDFKVVVADSGQAYLLQILESDGKPYFLRSFSDSIAVSLKNEIPRKFKAFLIQDRDTNDVFSPGDFKLNRLPEKRVPYSEELEIRANWELEIEWRYLP